jgi:broad specificity phosphatase PhoE
VTEQLLLVRHGVTTWNREGRFQGLMDAPLAEDGRLEARLLGERLAGMPDAERPLLVSSPLGRARDTAEIIAAALGLDPSSELRLDERLVEIGQGEWEGRTHDELARTAPERYAAWATTDREPPGAEPIPHALSRVAAAVDDLRTEVAPVVCLVSHGGILRLAARHLLQLEAARAWAMDVDNASLSELRREDPSDPWRLVRWNDTAHLLGRTEQHVDEAEGRPLAL